MLTGSRTSHSSFLIVFVSLSFVLFGCGGGTDDEGGRNPGGANTNPPPATNPPALSLTANPTQVMQNGSTTLSWSASEATACSASGNWSGNKGMSASETINGVTSSGNYTLTCTGPGGSTSRTVSVSVVAGGDSVSGMVDSSYIDREKGNHLYLYAGVVTPDDYDGDSGDPIMTVPVTQINNSCSWHYSIASLPDGDYTLGFTHDAGIDTPGGDESLSFRSVTTFSKAGTSLLHDIAAQNILRVGPGRQYTTPAAVTGVVKSGDVVEIDAGTYLDDVSVWRVSNLTLRGVGGRAHMKATKQIPYTPGNDQHNGKGIWVMYGRDIRVENIEFSGAKVPDANGAGIRGDGADLTVCNGYFHDNENGILGGGGNVLIEYSEFDYNGLGEYGRTHNMYVSGDKFTLQHSYSHHAYVGHNVKTRAKTNYILYNRIMDEATGRASYAVDVPDGGLTYLIGNNIQQGPGTDNSIMISYGAESLAAGRVHQLYVVNNTLVNDLGRGGFIGINGGALPAEVMNNIFTGGGATVSGPASLSNNLVTATPGLMDIANYDYRLTQSSAARDMGSDPGSGDGLDLLPAYEYAHPAARQSRNTDGALDIGAYEY